MNMDHMKEVFNPICPPLECCNPSELVCAEMICADNSQADAVCNPDTCQWSFNCDTKSNYTTVSFSSNSDSFIFAIAEPLESLTTAESQLSPSTDAQPQSTQTGTSLSVISKFLIGIVVCFIVLLIIDIALKFY